MTTQENKPEDFQRLLPEFWSDLKQALEDRFIYFIKVQNSRSNWAVNFYRAVNKNGRLMIKKLAPQLGVAARRLCTTPRQAAQYEEEIQRTLWYTAKNMHRFRLRSTLYGPEQQIWEQIAKVMGFDPKSVKLVDLYKLKGGACI